MCSSAISCRDQLRSENTESDEPFVSRYKVSAIVLNTLRDDRVEGAAWFLRMLEDDARGGGSRGRSFLKEIDFPLKAVTV